MKRLARIDIKPKMNEKRCLKGCTCCAENTDVSCKGCGGCCSSNLPLSTEERQLLARFAVLPFLPVIWNTKDHSIQLLESGLPTEKAGLTLSLLLRRRYANVDLDTPLKNYPYGSHPDCLLGSAALTVHGQDALDDLEYGG